MRFKSGMLGACIIVLSLLIGSAGSLLLNVDKTDEVTTAYNYVTDITGLFDVTNEPQYIDFNPASNYTGYQSAPMIYENTGNRFKAVNSGSISITPTSITVNGNTYPVSVTNGTVLLSSAYFLYKSSGNLYYRGLGGEYSTSYVNITINGINESITTDQTTYNRTISAPVLVHWPGDDYDYVEKPNASTFYYNDKSQFRFYGSVNYVSGTTTNNKYFIGDGDASHNIVLVPAGGSFPSNNNGFAVSAITDIDDDVKSGKAMFNMGVYNPAPGAYSYTLDGSFIFAPRYIQAGASVDLVYTPSLTANNYRIIKEYGAPGTGPSGTINNSTDLPQVNTNYEKRTAIYDHNEMVNGNTTLACQLIAPKVATLYSWVSSIMTIADYSTITFNFTYPATHAPTQKVRFSTSFNDVTGADPAYTIFGSNNWRSITINPADLTFTYVNSLNYEYGPYSLYNAYVIYGDCTQSESWLSSGPTIHYDTYNTSLSLSYTSTVTTANQYDYMIPNQGVTAYGDTVVWNNDTGSTNYDNYRVDILVGFPIVNGIYNKDFDNNNHIFRLGIIGASPNYDVIQISSSPQGFKYIYKSNSGLVYASGTIGKFDSVLISLIRGGEDNITAELYGVTTFTDYFNISYPTEPNKVLTLDKASNLNELYFYTDSNAISGLNWSVYNTNLFMDTYGAVLVDPSIDLADYWADMSSYRYAFQSFAIYGDSVTINNVTYPIEDEQITIDNKKYHFDNLYLSFSEQGKTSITFRDVNRTVDLGDTVDKVVSFGGTWYFTTGLYEGVQSIQSVYNWDISDPLANLDMVTMVLFTLGVMAVLCLLFVITKTSFSLMDKLVIAFGALLLFIILGVVY